MTRLLNRFLRDRRGNFAIITALMAVPVVGLTGLALDFSRGHAARTAMQGEADAIALAVAVEGPEAVGSRFFEPMAAAAKSSVSLVDVEFSGRWISPTDYEVTATSVMPLSLTAIIPGVGKDIAVDARSVARYQGQRLVNVEPELALADPEAGDYNRVYVYCFDPVLKTRGPMTAIADNFGTIYNFKMPQCTGGQTLSYHLYNVRDARTKQDQWDNPGADRYFYHTDTVLHADMNQDFDKSLDGMLETVLCPTIEKCKGRSQGGVLPEGKYREPERSSSGCPVGQFMYYGWEDRPDLDFDYDDIRVIIECPRSERTGFEAVKLVR